jgi:hypothetical protein
MRPASPSDMKISGDFQESGGAAMQLHTEKELCSVRDWGTLKEATGSGSRPLSQWCCHQARWRAWFQISCAIQWIQPDTG